MKPILLGAGIALIAAAWAISPYLFRDTTPVLDLKGQAARPEYVRDEVCPWRDPVGDRKHWFPASTQERDELVLVGRNRAAVESKLGRRVSPDETAMRVHRIENHGTRLGTIVTRRVRGESGVIELVVAIDTGNRVLGARIQRLREPGDVAKAIESPSWLDAWKGKTADANWTLGGGLPDVPAPAQPSARALADTARSTLVLLGT